MAQMRPRREISQSSWSRRQSAKKEDRDKAYWLSHGGDWERKEWSMAKEATHNHEPSSDTSAHPSLRRLTNEQVQKVRRMTKAGQAPRAIWAVLKQEYSDLNITMSDLYSLRGYFRTQGLGARTSIQAFLQTMQEGEIFHRYKLDEEGHVTHLLFAHPSSIELFRNHSDILLLDCTYNSNRFKMSLLNMAGATGMDTTLQIALAFLRAETSADYQWAMEVLKEMLVGVRTPPVIVTDRELALVNAINSVFPETHLLLCRWHVNKNFLKTCKWYLP